NGSAIFNEVLQINLDTNAFAAQLRQVEQQYDASIAKMQASTEKLNGFAKAGQDIQDATSYMDKFGAAIETALVRVPARLLVFTALAAAVAAIVEPIRMLDEGMSSLEGHSSAFNTLKEELADLRVG